MNQVQIFSNPEFGKIRVLEKDRQPWFVGKDVADILGYSETNAMTKRLDEEDFISDKLEGMNMKSTLINESGLYSAVLGSHLPTAKKFRRWVTSDVLPTIRKHGAYMTDNTLEKALTSPDFLIQLATKLKEERAARLVAEKKVEELKPAAEFYQAVAESKDAIAIGDAAKVLNMGLGRNRLFEILRSKSILMANNIPYQEYIDRGYFRTIEQKWTTPEGETRINIKTLVYQKGLNYIRKIVQSA